MIRKMVLGAALACASPAYGLDSISFETGSGEGTRLWRVGAQWNWEKRWFAERRWNIVAYWDLTAGVWDNHQNTLSDLGLTPTFRIQQRDFTGPAPYLEGAIGFHLLSDLRVSAKKIFSTHFQYADHIGAGVRFGERWRYDVSLRLQHLSNGSLRRPNPGINFLQLRLAYHLD